MSGRDRDNQARNKWREKYAKKVIKETAGQVESLDQQLITIQTDFPPNAIPIPFVIVDHKNIYFSRPSMTIDELLTGESLKNRTRAKCQRMK